MGWSGSKMFPYYFLRFSGPTLFILVALKVLSGYALTGKLAGLSWISGLHENRLLDISLLFTFIFIMVSCHFLGSFLLWLQIIAACRFAMVAVYFFDIVRVGVLRSATYAGILSQPWRRDRF
jgi:hypothetical protein